MLYSWGSRLEWKGVPAPSSAIAKMCQHPLGLPNVLGLDRTQSEPMWASRGLGSLGRDAARKEPFLLWVLRMCGPLEDSSRWLALTLSLGWGLFRFHLTATYPG